MSRIDTCVQNIDVNTTTGGVRVELVGEGEGSLVSDELSILTDPGKAPRRVGPNTAMLRRAQDTRPTNTNWVVIATGLSIPSSSTYSTSSWLRSASNDAPENLPGNVGQKMRSAV